MERDAKCDTWQKLLLKHTNKFIAIPKELHVTFYYIKVYFIIYYIYHFYGIKYINYVQETNILFAA